MNLSPLLAAALTTHGHEVLHWAEVGAFSAPDSEITAWALRHSYVVVTFDLDFRDVRGVSGAAGPSVIQLRAARVDPQAIATLIALAVRDHPDDLNAGCLLTLDTVRRRVRLLPLGRRSDVSAP